MSNRIQFIDGLRIILAIVVVFHHFTGFLPKFRGSHINKVLASLSDSNWKFALAPFFVFNGYLCVDLFYFIIGYTMFHYINVRKKENQNLKLGSLILRRTVKMIPPLLLVQLVCVFCLKNEIMFEKKLRTWEYKFAGISDVFSSSLNGPLFVLQKLYLANLFAFGVYFVMSSMHRVFKIVLCIATAAYLIGNTFNCSDYFIVFIGCCMYLVFGDFEKFNLKYLLLLLPLLVVPYLQIFTHKEFNNRFYRLPYSLGIFILCSRVTCLNKFLSFKYLALSAMVSYEMYLVHLPVFVFFDENLYDRLTTSGTTVPLYYGSMLVVVAILSVLLYLLNKYTFLCLYFRASKWVLNRYAEGTQTASDDESAELTTITIVTADADDVEQVVSVEGQ